jgi:hypothetical protein
MQIHENHCPGLSHPSELVDFGIRDEIAGGYCRCTAAAKLSSLVDAAHEVAIRWGNKPMAQDSMALLLKRLALALEPFNPVPSVGLVQVKPGQPESGYTFEDAHGLRREEKKKEEEEDIPL